VLFFILLKLSEFIIINCDHVKKLGKRDRLMDEKTANRRTPSHHITAPPQADKVISRRLPDITLTYTRPPASNKPYTKPTTQTNLQE